MNTPNKLTVARMIATPIFMAIMLIEALPFRYLISLVLFAAASLTDMIDGKMARKYNLVTDFGKFLDPLADKMLTTSAYLGFMFVFRGTAYSWQMIAIVFIVLFREFMVSSLRLVTVSSGGKVVAANMWGKAKTVSQMTGIVFALFAYALIGDFSVGTAALKEIFDIIIIALFWLSAVLCVISGGIYLFACKDFIDPTK
ncbi:MAG: CDP-diacylglycerol--glycerol-3-phosphate 3-phosphatidyltransferase [Clostridia bacterium]|nr:CDP-diacylglycerol--glycerol-3-phosphate 3-phosphatidyltransferase [Clostridia bacterium]